MRTLILLSLVSMFFLPSRGFAASILRVKAGATGANNGSSWTNAYTDLQTALAEAQWGDEIWVAAGTYKPTSGTDRNKSFVMTAGVAIYGGFAGTIETTRDQRDWKTHETILSGDIGIPGNISDNSYLVVAGGYNSLLDGFTVKGGTGSGMANDYVSPTIANCIFIGNSAIVSGGGGYGGGMNNLNGSSPTVTNCTFSGNSAAVSGGNGYGGGMNNMNGSSPKVTNCTFNDNSAADYGGGMNNIVGSSPVVTNCIFSGNTANYGGGMYNKDSFPTVINCIFKGNSAVNYGGGIFNNVCAPTVTNCILWDDRATYGPEVYNSSGTPTFSHCDIRGSGGSGTQWNPALGSDGGGNIMDDPKFANPVNPAGLDGIWTTADDGLALLGNSACINAGTTTGAPGTDILGNPRVGLPDIGAYEFQGGAPVIAPISDASLPDNNAYNGPTPVLTHGIAPFTWTLVTKPVGMTINATTGVVSWPSPTTTGSPFTVTIRAKNAFGQADASWKLTVYHPGPPSTPKVGLNLSVQVQTPSTSPDGQPVQYTYKWTSTGGDNVTHGPTTATSDTMTNMNLVQYGEIWTVTVTPSVGGLKGTAAAAKVRIDPAQNGVQVWAIYQ